MVKLDRPLDPERDRWFRGTLDSLVAKASDTGGVYGVVMRIAPRGFTAPIHQHSREDTGFLILDGRLTMMVGGVEKVMGPHEFAFAPRDVPHWFRVESEMARFIEIVTPGGFEGFHHATSCPAERYELPPADLAPVTPEELKAASSRYGTTVLGEKK